MKVRKIFNQVYDAGTYKEIDYTFAEKVLAEKYDGKGGCTCVMKRTDDGQMLIGRNMDLTMTDRSAYIVRTEVEGCYKTMGISYVFSMGPLEKDMEDEQIPDQFGKLLPLVCCDVMNEKGLYVEINMRTGENEEDGSLRFSCRGTNSAAPTRVCATCLSRYVCEHCADIEEALEYIHHELNLYTPLKGDCWNFCFMMADASGRYGLLELAQDQISWLEGQQAQTNFYVTPAFGAVEDYKAGIGRYETVMAGLADVHDEKDMYRLINQVSYRQIYYEDPGFDIRSEFVGMKPHWTTDYVMAEENQAEIQEKIDECIRFFAEHSRKEIQEAEKYWESIFTVVGNCSKKELLVRFFQDEERMIILTI